MTARRTLDLAMSEDELKETVLEMARTFGWLAHHSRPARTKHGWVTPVQGDPGFFDLVLIRAQRVLLVELKTERGKLTRDQQVWQDAGSGLVWRPEDLSSGHIERVLH